jgi:hypothetical protein
MTEIPWPIDLSHLSDEEVNRLAAGENIYLRAQPKPPPNIGGRPKASQHRAQRKFRRSGRRRVESGSRESAQHARIHKHRMRWERASFLPRRVDWRRILSAGARSLERRSSRSELLARHGRMLMFAYLYG